MQEEDRHERGHRPQRHALGVERQAAVAADPRSRWRRLAPPPLRGAFAALAIVTAVLAAWAAYQPVRSVHAGDEALERLEQGAYEPAVSIAKIAVDRNPLAVDPLFELAAIQQARGDLNAARGALEKAVRLQPANAETWRHLGRFRLDVLSDAPGALTALRAAYSLDPASPASVSDVLEATRATQAPTGAAPTP